MAVALLVHAVTVLLFGFGAYVLITGIPRVSTILIGAALIAVGLLLRPHFGKLDRGSVTVTRHNAPALFGLTDAVARSLGARPAEVIVVNGAFNAAHGKVGLRRRPVLWIGLALWNVLSGPERVALLGHEFGHQVNGDPTRGFITGTALRTLSDWYRLLHPRFRWKRTRSFFDFAELIGSSIAIAVIRAVGFLVGRLLRFEASLVFQSHQMAEYYADALAAQVGSADAAADCIDRLHLARPCTQAVVYAARRGTDDVWQAEREFVAKLPPKEFERLRRVDARHGTAIDSTHPPTGYRVALLRRLPSGSAAVTVTDADSQKIDKELRDARARVSERIHNRAAARR